jgi:hypothetical protein
MDSGIRAGEEGTMGDIVSGHRISRDNTRGARSEDIGDLRFRPAFFDFATQKLYLSRFADGRLAPLHLRDGLPEEAIVDRAPCGRVIRVRASLVCGFERNGVFYTRKAAARAAAALRGRARRAKAPV